MRRECCVILTSHILCWGNEKQMENKLPNMAQAWLWEKPEKFLFQFEEPTEPWLPNLGLWPTSFHDLPLMPRAGSLAQILPLMHKGSNWNKTERRLYQSGLPLGVRLSPASLDSHLAWRVSTSPPRAQWGTHKVVDSAAGKLSRGSPEWGLQGRPRELAIKWESLIL